MQVNERNRYNEAKQSKIINSMKVNEQKKKKGKKK